MQTKIARLQEASQAQLEQHINTIQYLSALVGEKDQEILLKESQLQQKNQELQKVNADQCEQTTDKTSPITSMLASAQKASNLCT